MILKLYKTDLRPEANEVFDSIEEFIGDCGAPVHQWNNLKYTRPDIDIMVKVPLDGSIRMLGQFDYAVLYDETQNKNYYYFVLNTNWKAHTTLQLQLSMDTLNTFWYEIQAGLGPQTHVTRRYFDRWKKVGALAYPLIDKHPEEISAPPMVQIAKPTAVGPANRWTLVYRTDYDSDVEVNPVTCYVMPENDTKISETLYGTYTLNKNSAAAGVWWAMTNGSNHYDSFSIKWGNQHKDVKMYDYSYAYFVIENDCVHVYLYLLSSPTIDIKADEVVFSICKQIYRQSVAFDTNVSLSSLDFNHPLVMNSGMSTGTLRAFESWYQDNKTDSRLVKIIELPYAPFNEEYDSDNKLIIPSGFDLYYGLLRYVGGQLGMESSVASFDNLAPDPFKISEVVNEAGIQKDANPDEYETKLWNSSYYSLKFIYDGNFHAVKLEEFEHFTDNYKYPLSIEFYPSTGIDNSIAFKFDCLEQLDTDFGDYLVANRTTEIPYYSNSYIEYMRFGNGVDERNKAFSVTSAAIGGVAGAVSTGASLAFALTGAGAASGGPIGAIVGAGIGLVSTAIATASSISKANDQMNSKIDQYTHQASSVQAANDLSVFKRYGKNKLLKVEYQPTKELRNSIGRYFHLYGYSCDEYGVPNWKTRIWSDYFVIEPQWWQTHTIQQYLADITTRLQAGFRVLHRVILSDQPFHYDFDSRYENWERSLIA